MRRGAARYDITALPTLGELGSKPPITLGEFREMLADRAWAREPVDAVLLLDDLTQRESFLSGESAEVTPNVLTTEQARNEAPLPEYLLVHDDETVTGLEVDRLWSDYFRYVAAMARAANCPFLRDWAAFEVGLRNALAVARAQRLGLPDEDYRVAHELDDSDEDFAPIVDEWRQAGNPLIGWRTVIRARWQWVEQHDAWFTFHVDELVAYAVKLMLLHQAYRITTVEDKSKTMSAGQAAGADEREDGNP